MFVVSKLYRLFARFLQSCQSCRFSLSSHLQEVIISKSLVSMSLKKLQWKDLSLDELELVLKTVEVTGEPEDYEYIRQDGKLRILSGESTVDIVINEMKAA